MLQMLCIHVLKFIEKRDTLLDWITNWWDSFVENINRQLQVQLREDFKKRYKIFYMFLPFCQNVSWAIFSNDLPPYLVILFSYFSFLKYSSTKLSDIHGQGQFCETLFKWKTFCLANHKENWYCFAFLGKYSIFNICIALSK